MNGVAYTRPHATSASAARAGFWHTKGGQILDGSNQPVRIALTGTNATVGVRGALGREAVRLP
ncbi:MAG TPA: hypothetical protein VFA46_16755 [Actinomycetes bacterium]|jgi:hypothetical protein|nr:hypothetical protein [Actinomycetes bacterium]